MTTARTSRSSRCSTSTAETVLDGADLGRVNVEARILAHERGPKLRVVKFKPKRGYKRRNGHRQELTRIEVTQITVGSAPTRTSAAAADDAPKPVAAEPGGEATTTTEEAGNGA